MNSDTVFEHFERVRSGLTVEHLRGCLNISYQRILCYENTECLEALWSIAVRILMGENTTLVWI